MESHRKKWVNAINLTKINPILQKLTGKTTYLLWENEEEKKIVLKYIYDYCENNIYDKEKIYELSLWSGVSCNKIEEYAKKYAIEYLGHALEEYNQKKIEYGQIRNQNKKKEKTLYYPRIYEKILNTTTLEEIINILSEPGIKLQTLMNYNDYINRHCNGDEKVKEKLKSKIKMYTDYISQKNKQELDDKKTKEREEKLPKAIEIAKSFISNNDFNSIEYFCKKNKLDKKTFKEYLSIVLEYNKELYDMYYEKTEKLKKTRYFLIAKQIYYIIDCIKYGMKELDFNRPFDLIDYYESANIPLEEVIKLAKDIVSPEDLNVIKKFVIQNINGSTNNPGVIKQIISEKVIIKYEKDSKGNPIPGTEELFSNEEKEKLINYLQERNIPINLKTYNTLYRRYRNGTIDINQTEKLKR